MASKVSVIQLIVQDMNEKIDKTNQEILTKEE